MLYPQIKVLMISHTCQSRLEGQPKARHLAQMKEIELSVVVPNRWRRYGRWRKADTVGDKEGLFHIAHVRWPWLGPAQCYLHWYPQLVDILCDFRPDVIDLWEEPWGLVSAHTCWLRNQHVPNAKIVAETEQNINKRLPFPFELFRRYTLRNAQYVVGRNDEAIEHVRSKGYDGPAETVPNGVDADLFRPMDREACRHDTDLPPNKFVIGYIGRFVEEKGVLDLLDATAICGRDIFIVMVGSGPLEEMIRQRARQLNIDDRLMIVHECPQNELPQIVNAMDVLVLPSRTTRRWKEQFGRVLIESQSCGTPVIGTDSGAIAAVIGQAGLIVPEGNMRALAAAIQRLRQRSDLRAQLGELGRRQVLAKYAWQRVSSQMRTIYERIVTQVPATKFG